MQIESWRFIYLTTEYLTPKLKEKPGNSLKQLGFYGSWLGIFPREAVFGKYISFFPSPDSSFHHMSSAISCASPRYSLAPKSTEWQPPSLNLGVQGGWRRSMGQCPLTLAEPEKDVRHPSTSSNSQSSSADNLSTISCMLMSNTNATTVLKITLT